MTYRRIVRIDSQNEETSTMMPSQVDPSQGNIQTLCSITQVLCRIMQFFWSTLRVLWYWFERIFLVMFLMFLTV